MKIHTSLYLFAPMLMMLLSCSLMRVLRIYEYLITFAGQYRTRNITNIGDQAMSTIYDYIVTDRKGQAVSLNSYAARCC